jgi:hypothetical protein
LSKPFHSRSTSSAARFVDWTILVKSVHTT